jgi:hypothetical protein
VGKGGRGEERERMGEEVGKGWEMRGERKDGRGGEDGGR